MVHTCAKCGRVYPDSSAEILTGCSQCGGKKFYFERPPTRPREAPPTGTSPVTAAPAEPAPRPDERTSKGEGTMVESIRIVAPGTYELNIEKMATSDDRVVRLGQEGSYAVDLLSMAGSRKKKKGEK